MALEKPEKLRAIFSSYFVATLYWLSFQFMISLSPHCHKDHALTISELLVRKTKTVMFLCAVSIMQKVLTADCQMHSVIFSSIFYLQCESKKSSPSDLQFSDIFKQTVENFKSVFYTPIIRSYLC